MFFFFRLAPRRTLHVLTSSFPPRRASVLPFLFLLMLLPTNGMTVAKGYITGFFYLAACGPLFVILNMIFMSRWQDSLASWGANGGLTAANFSGISALNQDVGALAGYMKIGRAHV